jgi:hypothetical protein
MKMAMTLGATCRQEDHDINGKAVLGTLCCEDLKGSKLPSIALVEIAWANILASYLLQSVAVAFAVAVAL